MTEPLYALERTRVPTHRSARRPTAHGSSRCSTAITAGSVAIVAGVIADPRSGRRRPAGGLLQGVPQAAAQLRERRARGDVALPRRLPVLPRRAAEPQATTRECDRRRPPLSRAWPKGMAASSWTTRSGRSVAGGPRRAAARRRARLRLRDGCGCPRGAAGHARVAAEHGPRAASHGTRGRRWLTRLWSAKPSTGSCRRSRRPLRGLLGGDAAPRARRGRPTLAPVSLVLAACAVAASPPPACRARRSARATSSTRR